MTKDELIEMAKRGKRIPPQPHSLHDWAKDIGSHEHHWRVIVCDGETDVRECLHCGAQSVASCDFDEDYA